MRRALIIIISLMLVLTLSAGAAWAKPGGGKEGGHGKGNSSISTSSVENTGENENVTNRDYRVKIEKGKIEIKGNGRKFELKNGKLEFKSERGKVKIKNSALEQFRERYRERLREYRENAVRGAAAASKFADIQNHWARSSIEKLAAINLFNGYEDGTFRPDEPVTGAEAVALVMRLAVESEPEESGEEELTEESAGNEEIDSAAGDDTGEETDEEIPEGELDEVPAWSREAVREAARRGIINLNRFHSRVQAERARVAVWVAKALGLQPVDTAEIPFKDAYLIAPEDVGYIMALYKEGLIAGTPGGKFNPNSAITRAELAAIMERLLAGEAAGTGDEVAAGDKEPREEESPEETGEDSEENVISNTGNEDVTETTEATTTG